MNRQTKIEEIRQNPDVSVLIIGAGINGISTFRELALQGVDVLLVDRGDYCSGASAASSHMVHGGLRYLENAEFRLVREALYERNQLLRNAPHYVKPLPTTIPIFSWFSGLLNAPLKFLGLRDKPGERGALVIRIGLMFYDIFSRRNQVMPNHKFALRGKSLRQRPQLNADIVATATYYDAWMPYPERICMELILDTQTLSNTAHALNYVSLQGVDNGVVSLQDELTGQTLAVKPKVVVNAAGPWIDFANDRFAEKTRFIGGTKGSHLVIDNPALHAATQGHELFFENTDGRICLFFPLQDKVLVGTTDIPIEDPDDAICTDDEITYMLEMIRIVFPSIPVERSQIVFTFSGVRPLPATDAANPGQISRDHKIEVTQPGNGANFPVYSLIGGKWTTFRAFGEQVADKILRHLGQSREVDTHDMAIGGGRQYPQTGPDQMIWVKKLHAATGLPEERLRILFDRYGTYAEDVAAFLAAGEDSPLAAMPDYSRREIEFLATYEHIAHLDDLLLRRSLLAMLGYASHELIEEIAPIVGQVLDWSAEEMPAEIERTVQLLRSRHRIAE